MDGKKIVFRIVLNRFEKVADIIVRNDKLFVVSQEI